MHCAGNRLRPSHWLALFFKAAQARCHCPGFACMNAMISLRKPGAMAKCSWECVKHLARRTVCMCLPFPMRRTLNYLVSATIRGDMAIVTSRRRQLAANTTSVRARWRILRNCATLSDGRSLLGATNTSILKPTNFATSRPPAKILCVRFGRDSTPRFNSAFCDCDYGKRPTIVLLCAGCSPSHLKL